jgi:hypothetical protein
MTKIIPDNLWVYFIEPDGMDQQQTRHIYMSGKDAAAIHLAKNSYPYSSDMAALDDFCVIHSATKIPQPKFPTGADSVEDWTGPYLKQISDCQDHESRLSDWERSFLSSLESQLEMGKRPSPRQIEVLERIYDKVS